MKEEKQRRKAVLTSYAKRTYLNPLYCQGYSVPVLSSNKPPMSRIKFLIELDNKRRGKK